jgi:hypothetical protein
MAGLGRKFIAVWFVIVFASICSCQTTEKPDQLKSVCVADFADRPGARLIREKVISRLHKARLSVSDNPGQCDATLTGTGQITRVGVRRPSPNSIYLPSYQGSLVLDLRDQAGRILWSCRLKPNWSYSSLDTGAEELARQAIRSLKRFLSSLPNPNPKKGRPKP